MDAWYLSNIVCPRDHSELQQRDDILVCPTGHAYPIVDGVPVMLLDDVSQTMPLVTASLKLARDKAVVADEPQQFYVESIGISDEERKGLIELALGGYSKIDPRVAYLVAATNGNMYRHLVGNLNSYPIPDLHLPPGNSQSLLDLGCNWGRWSIAAARKGYETVGIDPSLGAIMAARRVSDDLGVSIKYLVADARYLPFRSERFDIVFSYSVMQHMGKDDVRLALSDVGRTLTTGGSSFIQMATCFGLRSLYQQARRRFRTPRDFEVRYWTIPALMDMFDSTIGRAEISVDCFFGLGLQSSDAYLMPTGWKLVLAGSDIFRELSHVLPILRYVADSVYVKAIKS